MVNSSIPPSRPSIRIIPKLSSGDLVSVKKANPKINAYASSKNFSFSNVVFSAQSGEMGIVLNTFTDRQDNILFHYVEVLFQRGLVGIVHSGLLENLNDELEENCANFNEKCLVY